VRHLEIFVETVTLSDELRATNSKSCNFKIITRSYVLFPLPKASLFRLDLLREMLPEVLLFLLELRVVELLDFALAELASLHLLLPVVLIVRFFGSGYKVQHESTN